MKRGKASGPDKIPAEAIKADIETSTEILHYLIEQIWEQEETPTEWKEGYLVKLPKKGDRQRDTERETRDGLHQERDGEDGHG